MSSPNPYHATSVSGIDLDRAAAQNLQLVAANAHQRAGRAARRRAAVHDAAASREDLLDRLGGRGGRLARRGWRWSSVSGRPSRGTSACAVGCDDWRTATQPSATSAAGRLRRAGSAMVSAPGQWRCISAARERRRRHGRGCSSIVAPVDEHRDRLAVPPLERAQARERQLVQRVDAQAVERLRRIGDDLAPPQRRDREDDLLVEGVCHSIAARGSLSAPAPRTSASLSRTFLRRAARSASTRLPSSASPTAMICAASRPAFSAPPIATVATGMPGGICTVDSSESRPPRLPETTGTPMTGRVVCAATAPARCAAPPAPQMNALTPRRAGVLHERRRLLRRAVRRQHAHLDRQARAPPAPWRPAAWSPGRTSNPS